MKDYILKMGVDGENLINPLDKAINKMEAVSDVAKETGKSLNDAFANGAKSTDLLDEKLKPVTKGLEAIKVLGKQAGKELADAFNNRNVDPSALEKAVVGFRAKLDSLGKGIEINIDDSKLKVFEKQLEGAKNEVDELRVAVGFANEVLNTLDPNSAEFQQLAEGITYVETALNEFGAEVDQTVGKNKTLKAELKSIKNELNAMEEAGEAGSQKFRQLQLRAGQLADQIGDTNAQVKILASDTAKFDGLISGVTGLVGGFTAVQGAVALFGAENEELEKTLIKVNGAMAVLQGLQAVADTLNKDSAFNVIFLSGAKKADALATNAQTTAMGAQAVATRVATVATKGFSLALKAIGIGLVITAIAYLVEHWDDLKNALNKVLPAGQNVGKMFDRIKSVAFGVGNAIVQYLVAPIKAVYYATQGEWKKAGDALANGFKITSNYQKEYQKQNLRNDQKYRDETERKNIDFAKRELERRKNRGENVQNLEQRLRAREMAYMKRRGEDISAIQKEYEDESDKHIGEMSKKRQSDAKKAGDDAKKAREEEAKRAEELRKQREEEAKRNAELVRKYADETAKIELESMEEGLQKTLAQIELERASKIDALKEDGAKTAEAIAEQSKLIDAINADALRKKLEAEKRNTEEVIKLRLEGLKMLEDFSVESAERELNLAKYEHEGKIASITEQFKNETELREKLLTAEAEYFARKQSEIRSKYAKKELAEEEEKLILTAELASLYAGQSERTEEQKQLAILEIKSRYAKLALEQLMSSGAEEGSVEVLKAQKLVEETQSALDKQMQKGKKFDFFEFIGLDISSDQKKAVMDAGAELLNGVSQITDALVDNYQKQIEAKQEVIDQLDNEISDLEGRLEDERELKDAGFANDYELIQKELEAKKAQKDEEIRQQEELVKKQQQIQKAQMAVDTAVQMVNMITSATEIFKSLSGIPFVGVPLAIATIATMFGAFAVTKVKAFQAIKAGQQFRYGGEIGGNSHEAGGVRYYSEDGRNIELEGGEFVVRKDKRRKYRGLLDAMNSGDFNGLTIADVGLKSLFADLGISFDTETVGDAVSDSKKLSNLKNDVKITVNNPTDVWRRMDGNLEFLARKRRDEVETWEDDEFYYTRRGTKTNKRRKN